MSTPQPASTASKLVQGVVGCAGLLFAGFVILAAVALVIPSRTDESAEPRRDTQHPPTRINGSVEQFRARLAELLPGETTKKPADGGGVRHFWKAATNSTNWAQFWDDRDDGTIEQAMIGVALPLNDDARILEALAIAVVIVETAGGVAVHGPTFTEWVRQSMGSSETQRRRFGSATVSVSAMGAQDGVVLLFGIGDEGDK